MAKPEGKAGHGDFGAPAQVLRFNDVEVDPRSFSLRRRGKNRKLGPRAFDVLLYLIRHRNRVVEKEELFREIWQDQFVGDNSLTRAVKEIRKATGDDAQSPRYLKTVARRGYRFIADLETAPLEAAAEPPGGSASLAVGGNWLRRRWRWAAALLLTVGLAMAAYLHWASMPTESPRVRIAVLPFQNLGPDPEEEYLGDGLTAEMISQLARLSPRQLSVVALTSSLQYRGSGKGVEEIGRELDVDWVLEGSVRHWEDELRLTAQLVRVTDQAPLWAASYQRPWGDLLAIQREVAHRIADALQLELISRSNHEQIRTDPTTYAAYLKGLYHWAKWNDADWEKSLEQFRFAADRDPQFAPAQAAMARPLTALGFSGARRPRVAFTEARKAALRALEIDPASSAARLALGMVALFHDRDWSSAHDELQRAIDLNPNESDAYLAYANYCWSQGLWEEAHEAIAQARSLAPISLIINSAAGWTFYYQGLFDNAVREAETTLELEPNFVPARATLGLALAQLGESRRAANEIERACTLAPEQPSLISSLSYARALADDRQGAEQALDQLKQLSTIRYVSPLDFALARVGLGRLDAAFDDLEEAGSERVGAIIFLPVDPRFETLHSDPRYPALLSRLGLKGN